MKLLIVAMGLLFSLLPMQSGFYGISLERLEGTQLRLSSFSGKKVLVVPFNGAAPDTELLQGLEAMQQAHADSLVVVAVPALDMGGTVDEGALVALRDSLRLTIAITRPVQVKRGAGQHPLFSWLTQAEQNSHFDREVERSGQHFFISEAGVLYGVLVSRPPARVLNRVLQQQVRE